MSKALGDLDIDEVASWLKSISLDNAFLRAFKEQQIDGGMLEECEQDDFDASDFPLARKMHWKKFWCASLAMLALDEEVSLKLLCLCFFRRKQLSAAKESGVPLSALSITSASLAARVTDNNQGNSHWRAKAVTYKLRGNTHTHRHTHAKQQ